LWPTVLVPAATQLPVFAASSLVAWEMCAAPTPLDAEAFASLTSLSHPDPVLALPIAVGLITLANVDASLWFRDAAALERQRRADELHAARLARGEKPVRTAYAIKNGARLLSVGRILWASTIPGVSVAAMMVGKNR
jgi:inner membrane protein COX18